VQLHSFSLLQCYSATVCCYWPYCALSTSVALLVLMLLHCTSSTIVLCCYCLLHLQCCCYCLLSAGLSSAGAAGGFCGLSKALFAAATPTLGSTSMNSSITCKCCSSSSSSVTSSGVVQCGAVHNSIYGHTLGQHRYAACTCTSDRTLATARYCFYLDTNEMCTLFSCITATLSWHTHTSL
jgi:hypothetical protein